jgi:glycerol-3-phosphate acyltransferase PlsY
MVFFIIAGVLILAYLLGSIPSGLLIVKIKTGKDIRKIESGRTGGTNVARAAGFWAGLGTATLDMLKSAGAVWMAQAILPHFAWVHFLAPLAAVLGHNYSIFLLERKTTGGLHLRGGAGGAPAVGGAFGLWPPSLLIILPVAALILYFIGYASIATMSVGLLVTLIFAVRAWLGLSPWAYAFFGILVELLLILALRPNIIRLFHGNERLVGYRARPKS